jgi:hypothetical protein
MSIDPKEVASFADLVAKMNSIDAGNTVKPKTNHVTEGMKANDMSAILENMYRDQPFESAKTVSTKEFEPGYKPKQLPADYKMPSVGPVLGGDEEKIPTKGYMVGDSIDPDMIAQMAMDADEIDITDKGEYDEEGAMSKDQLARAADAALELQGILDDDENLPEWVQNKITKALDYLDTSRDYMKQELDEYTPHPGSEESWDGVSPDTDQTLSGPINPAPKAAELPEDQVGKKRSIMDFVDDIENKAQNNKLVEPVKTYERDGKTIKIFGTEDDGYRVKVNNKDSAKTFGKLENAVRACETFLERLEERARLQNDYVDEK